MAGYGYDYSCSGCDTKWRDIGFAHCASCHRTFGGVGGLDRHRHQGTCVDPNPIDTPQRSDGIYVGRYSRKG